MSMTATSRCFYCGGPINRRGGQPYVYAGITHHYKNATTRFSDRNFHVACFHKFREQGGRPFNPHTDYTVEWAQDEREVADVVRGHVLSANE